jgi:hypothetical protein
MPDIAISIIVGITDLPLPAFLFLDPKLPLLKHVEIIIINQTNNNLEEAVDYPNSVIVNTSYPIGASKARNLGGKLATGGYLWFLDSDCDLIELTLGKIHEYISTQPWCDLVLLERSYSGILYKPNLYKPNFFGTYVSCNTAEVDALRYATEWNFLIKREVFRAFNGFPEIGTGSSHPAQSGECYALMCMLLAKNISVEFIERAIVNHPSYTKHKPLLKTLGYYYGTGYSICRYCWHLTPRSIIHEHLRNVIGCLYLVIRPKHEMLVPTATYKYSSLLIAPTRIALLTARFIGSLHGILSAILHARVDLPM